MAEERQEGVKTFNVVAVANAATCNHDDDVNCIELHEYENSYGPESLPSGTDLAEVHLVSFVIRPRPIAMVVSGR